jgi:hypothetical protein
MVMVIWVILLFSRAANAAPGDWSYIVSLPEPYYQYADGTPLLFSEFKGTKVMWGSCDEDNVIGELRGEVMAKSWQFKVPIQLKPGEVHCIVAVVIGLDGDPLGRSIPVKVDTRGTRPSSPVIIGVEQA